MRRERILSSCKLAMLGLVAFAASPPALAAPAAAAPSRVWVQMTEAGAEVRAVVSEGACPAVRIDGVETPLKLRAAADGAFPAVCAARLPPDARKLEAFGHALDAPRPVVNRIVVFGDSGCRLKGPLVQACNDPRAWPFAQVARLAAARHPDLVIHVGDYYYRESPCPVGDLGCEGSPSGDRWGAWAADFFDPAAPLLAAAPWVFVRGNHESCGRGAMGWFRLLDAAAAPKACPNMAAAWSVPIGGLNLYVLDSADADDRVAEPGAVRDFAGQLEALAGPLAHEPGWIVVHRPIWGLAPVVRVGPIGPLDASLNLTEQAAVRGRDLGAVRLVLSGHIHDFSSLDFGPTRPAQLIVGTGGDVGLPADTAKVTTQHVQLDGLAALRTEFDRFGYMVLDRASPDGGDWRGVFYDAQDRPVVDCRLEGRALACSKPSKATPP